MNKTNKNGSAQNLLAFIFRILPIKSLSVYQLTLILLLGGAILSVGLIFTGLVYAESIRVKAKIRNIEEVALEKQKEKLKTEVSQLIFYLENVQRDTLHHSIEQIKDETLKYFERMRFGNDGYVFVNTYDGYALLFDGEKLEEPKKMSLIDFPGDINLFEVEMELAKLPEGGSFQYLFKKIYDEKPQPKMSYIMGYDQWGWIIGVGDYLDNLNDEINLLKNELKNDLYENLLIVFVVFLTVFIFLILIASSAAKSIQNQFNLLVNFINTTPSNKPGDIRNEHIFIRELESIGYDIARAQALAKQFGDIIDRSINEIYIFGQADLSFVHANKGAIKNCGYSLDELQVMTAIDLKPELNMNQFLALAEPLKQKQSEQIRFETNHQRKDKSLYPVEVHLTQSVFNNEAVYVAFVYDISVRKEAENKLLLSNQRYFNLFNNAPISLWDEDYTELINYLNEQMEHYTHSVENLLDEKPEVLKHCSDLVKIIDVNNYTLDLYEAESKPELMKGFDKIFTASSFDAFKQCIVALYSGKKYFSAESKNNSLKGKNLDLFLRWSFLPVDKNNTQKVIVSVLDLTELRKKETDLKASEARFRSVFENDHIVMFLIDPDNGRFIDVNPAALKFYGYTYQQFINQLSLKDINTRSQEEILTQLKISKNQKHAYYNFDHRLANGEIRSVEIYSGPLQYESKPVLFSIVHDITEKKKAEINLEFSKNKLESIFLAAPTGIGLIENRVFTEINNRFCEMTGYSQKELIGKNARILYTSQKEYERVGKVVYNRLEKNKIVTLETTYKQKSGALIDVLISFTPNDMPDSSEAVTFTSLDITERNLATKELEKHRNHLEELVEERTQALNESHNNLVNLVDDLNAQSSKLEKANKRLEEINEELETFTYSVSHDLKAPLRGIDGYSQLLLETFKEELNPEAKDFLENIRKSTFQMNLLIEDLLAYSRMERKDFLSQKVALKPIIDNTLLQFSNYISENKVEIKADIPENFQLFVDKDGLELILRNLMDNALKFSIPSGNSKIELGCSEDDEKWVIFVKDNGIGFDMKYHDRIFKIFQRLHLAEEYEGTGIGLAMVSKAAQRMNGKIRAESKPSKGTTFYLEIRK